MVIVISGYHGTGMMKVTPISFFFSLISWLLLVFSIETQVHTTLSVAASVTLHSHARKKHEKVSVPILSVSLNVDRNHYVKRMIFSIDHPVEKLIIQIGNEDNSVVDALVREIDEVKRNLTASRNENITSIKIFTKNMNPGSANGFNFGLRELKNSSTAAWVLVINSDITFYPGVLQRVAKMADRAIHKDDKFGLGFTDLCCGSEWSAVVFSKRLLEAIGLFDENFYPAYYEDDDYAIRTHLAQMHALKFNDTALLHGEIDGSKDYLSGVFKELYIGPEKKSPAMLKWRRMFEYGQAVSKTYIEKKWGISMDKKAKMDCKSISGINHMCRPGYKTPFNNPFYNLSHWELDDTMRQAVIRAGGK